MYTPQPPRKIIVTFPITHCNFTPLALRTERAYIQGSPGERGK